MNNLAVFAYQDRAVRTYRDEKGNIWFCLADILSAMHSTTTVSAAVEQIRNTLGDGFVSNKPITDELQREQEVLSESSRKTLPF